MYNMYVHVCTSCLCFSHACVKSNFIATWSIASVFVYIAPSGSPTQFHVIVLNSTAIEAEWNPPLFNLRNGNIRGYKLFIQPVGGEETVIDIVTNASVPAEYIVSELQPNTAYILSILAYTTADGVRSIHLTARTYREGG